MIVPLPMKTFATHVEFPPYGLFPFGTEIVVCGGGGETKSGVKNGVSVLSFNAATNQWSEKRSLETENVAPMCGTKVKDYFLIGLNEKLALVPSNCSRIEKKIAFHSARNDGYIKCVSGSNSTVYSGGTDGKVFKLSVPDLEKLMEYDVKDEVNCIDYCGKNETLCIGTDHNIWIFGTHHSQEFNMGENIVRACKFLNKTSLALCYMSKDKRYSWISRYELSEDDDHWKLVFTHKLGKRKVTCIELSHNKSMIAIGLSDGSTLLLSAFTFKTISTFSAIHDLAVTGLCFSKDDQCIFSASADHSVIATNFDANGMSFLVDSLLSMFVMLLLYFILLLSQ